MENVAVGQTFKNLTVIGKLLGKKTEMETEKYLNSVTKREGKMKTADLIFKHKGHHKKREA